MRAGILYIHGKGGNAGEARQFQAACQGYDLRGVDLPDLTPWGAESAIQKAFRELEGEYGRVSLLANSLGAYCAMYALRDYPVERALFISPILDLERLILDMLSWAGANEGELRERGEIPTDFGETLSWEYLDFVRAHPIRWPHPHPVRPGGSHDRPGHSGGICPCPRRIPHRDGGRGALVPHPGAAGVPEQLAGEYFGHKPRKRGFTP